MKTVLDTLPAAYRQNNEQQEIADALTRGANDVFEEWENLINNFEKLYLNPATALPEWLDYLSAIAGWGNLWDSSWTTPIKRSLLANSDYIWRIRGSKLILPFLFKIFALNADLQPTTGFILNQTLFPGGLDADPFSYIVKVPANYTQGSPEYSSIQRLIKDFLPCWLTISIQS